MWAYTQHFFEPMRELGRPELAITRMTWGQGSSLLVHFEKLMSAYLIDRVRVTTQAMQHERPVLLLLLLLCTFSVQHTCPATLLVTACPPSNST